MERGQFTFYRSYYEAVKHLNKSDRSAVLMAICAYALDEELPSLSGTPAAIFALVKPTLDTSRKKAESGKRGGDSEANRKQTESKPQANRKQTEREKESEKENEKEGENEIEKEDECPPPTPSTFTPPTVDQVRDYCRERKNRVDPQRFVDFYTSNGWKVGKNKMKDWKAAVRTWENSDKQQGRKDNGFATSNPFLEMLQEERGL